MDLVPSMIEIIKKISAQTNQEGMPVAIRFGKVVQEKPLKIEVEQKLLLEKEHEHLILTHLVRDYTVFMSGIGNVLVKNGLKNNEEVILLQLQGGQQFIVLDRINDPIIEEA